MSEPKAYSPTGQVTALSIGGISDELANSLCKAYKDNTGYSASVSQNIDAFIKDAQDNYNSVLSWPYQIDPAQLAVLYDEEPTHRACCHVKAAAVLANGYQFEHRSREARTVPPGMVSDFESLFGHDGVEELVRRVETDYGALGNAFIEVMRDQQGVILNGARQGAVRRFKHVPAFTMFRLAPVKAGAPTHGDFVQIVGSTRVYFREFGTEASLYQSFEGRYPQEMIHLREYSPTNAWYGIPSIWSSLYAALSNRLQHLNVIEFFEDKGISRYLLIMDGGYQTIDEENQSTLTNYINSLMAVRGNKLVMIGTPNGTVSTLQELRTDLKFDEYNVVRSANRDEICRSHGVPPRIVAIVSSSALGGTGEGETQFELFKSLVVNPRQRAYERLFDRVFFSQNTRRNAWTVNFRDIDYADALRKAQALNTLVRGGMMNINEARSSEGMPGIGKDGDRYIIVSGGMPVPIDQIDRVAALTGQGE